MGSKKLTGVLCGTYLVFLTWIILFKMSFSLQELPEIRSVNLIPFGESVMVNGRLYAAEILDNVLAFIPFGIFMGLLGENRSFWKKLAPVFGVSLFYEVMQFVLGIGASDITDLIANTLGGILGIAVVMAAWKIFGVRVRKVLNGVCLVGAGLLIGLVGLLVVANM